MRMTMSSDGNYFVDKNGRAIRITDCVQHITARWPVCELSMTADEGAIVRVSPVNSYRPCDLEVIDAEPEDQECSQYLGMPGSLRRHRQEEERALKGWVDQVMEDAEFRAGVERLKCDEGSEPEERDLADKLFPNKIQADEFREYMIAVHERLGALDERFKPSNTVTHNSLTDRLDVLEKRHKGMVENVDGHIRDLHQRVGKNGERLDALESKAEQPDAEPDEGEEKRGPTLGEFDAMLTWMRDAFGDIVKRCIKRLDAFDERVALVEPRTFLANERLDELESQIGLVRTHEDRMNNHFGRITNVEERVRGLDECDDAKNVIVLKLEERVKALESRSIPDNYDLDLPNSVCRKCGCDWDDMHREYAGCPKPLRPLANPNGPPEPQG